MRRPFGPFRGAARQDVPDDADMTASSKEETEFEAWVAQRKAKKKGGGERREAGDKGGVGIRSLGDGQILNGRNRRTGIRNRR